MLVLLSRPGRMKLHTGPAAARSDRDGHRARHAPDVARACRGDHVRAGTDRLPIARHDVICDGWPPRRGSTSQRRYVNGRDELVVLMADMAVGQRGHRRSSPNARAAVTGRPRRAGATGAAIERGRWAQFVAGRGSGGGSAAQPRPGSARCLVDPSGASARRRTVSVTRAADPPGSRPCLGAHRDAPQALAEGDGQLTVNYLVPRTGPKQTVGVGRHARVRAAVPRGLSGAPSNRAAAGSRANGHGERRQPLRASGGHPSRSAREGEEQ